MVIESPSAQSMPGNRRYGGAQKRLFDLLNNNAVLTLFDPHRDLFAGLEREAVIAGHIRRDGYEPGSRGTEFYDLALSLL